MTRCNTRERALVRGKQAKSPLLMLTALLLVNFAIPQAHAALIAGKGMRLDMGATTLPADTLDSLSVMSLDSPEFFQGGGDLMNDFFSGKGCRSGRTLEGTGCVFPGGDSIIPTAAEGGQPGMGNPPPGSVGSFSSPELAAASDLSSVPVPGTLLLLGLGMASLGMSRRRR